MLVHVALYVQEQRLTVACAMSLRVVRRPERQLHWAPPAKADSLVIWKAKMRHYTCPPAHNKKDDI